MIHYKSADEIELLKESGAILSSILKEIQKRAKVGTRLEELNDIAITMTKEAGARPTFLGYQPEGARRPFPAAICASLNGTVVHGIPNKYSLKSGDIISIDMGVTYKGMVTDSAITIPIGRVSPQAKRLIQGTQKALLEGLKMAKKGNTIGDIGWAIARRAKKEKLYVLHGLTGHGVGYELHEDPVIYNFGDRGDGPKIKEGMVLAIEPMFSTSSEEIIQKSDESYEAAGKGLTAHFEHTIAITKKGNIILTA